MLKKGKEKILFWWAIALILLIPCIDARLPMSSHETLQPLMCYPLVVAPFLYVSQSPAFPMTLIPIMYLLKVNFIAEIVVLVIFYLSLLAFAIVFVVIYRKNQKAGMPLRKVCGAAILVAGICLFSTLGDTIWVMVAGGYAFSFQHFVFSGYWVFYTLATIALIVLFFLKRKQHNSRKQEAEG